MTQSGAHSLSSKTLIGSIGAKARAASGFYAQLSEEQINHALQDLAKILPERTDSILEANAKDLASAREKGLSDAMIDRLTLTSDRIETIAQSVFDIAALPDPVGNVLEEIKRPNNLVIQKVSVPIGVLGMIYESRPNVTVDAAALCLKSHNAVILRGGSEALQTSVSLHGIIQDILNQHNIPADGIAMLTDPDRAHVSDMLKARDYIDVIIPRGGRGLTERVMTEATMPVFAHLDGNCHIYIHESADAQTARDIVLNAKLRRTGICGAAESLLLDASFPEESAKFILQALLDQGCEIRGDQKTQNLDDRIKAANESDWSTEYLDKVISCKYVNNTTDAADHINTYGSHHTDAIIAEDQDVADTFLKNVDSAIVMHNTSTQFADGGEFGMGAEIGIGTGKLHARGPVGLKQLTTFKYIVRGTGQTRP